ncbi:MAG TPA: D-glycero-beta-D-manno-heptose-7-phosphate kinase [Gemmataceae bacterium]|jgi:D-beta-D-heptose 7-phosphate kinase/D-beta-D-heptose 1-phosphate adenosyltransferase
MKNRVLAEVAAEFPGKRALIVGDVMLDEFIWGEVQRISPEAPVPVVESRRRSFVAGGAANTAANIASLGGTALLAGVVGLDLEGEQLAKVLRQARVDSAGLMADPDRVTTTKTRIIARNQQVARVDRESRDPLCLEVEDRLLDWVGSQLRSVDVCVLSDYAKGVVSSRLCERLIRLAAEEGKPVVVDPKGTDYTKYRGATVVKPNQHEVECVLKGEVRTRAGWSEGWAVLTALLPGTALLISRGPEGMSLFRPDTPPMHLPSMARAVFDVTGAGDTVVATVALSLAAGATLEVAAQVANRAAGIAVAKVGTAAVTLAELQTHLAGRRRSWSRQAARAES